MNGWKIKCDNTHFIFMPCLPDAIHRTQSLNRRYVRFLGEVQRNAFNVNIPI
jgi:hypothetical protein